MYEYLDRRYALALYDLAKEKDNVDKCLNELRQVIHLINTNEDIIQIIKHPQISTFRKKEMFNEIFKGKIDEDILAFLLVLIEKGRIENSEGILAEIEKIDLEKKGIISAEVVTAIKLTDEETTKLIENLENRYNKKIKLEEKIDKSIIGGVYIRVGDDVIDGTLKNRLYEMKKIILKEKNDVVNE